MAWSVIDGIRDQGYSVTLVTQGRVNSRELDVIDLSNRRLWNLAWRVVRRIARAGGRSDLAERAQNFQLQREVNRFETVKDEIVAVIALCTAPHPATNADQISKILKVPLILREHRNYLPKIRSPKDISPKMLEALQRADFVGAVSPHLAETMKSVGVRQEISVIPNSISNEFFKPPTEPLKLDNFFDCSDQDLFVFGGWTKWRNIKRIDVLIQAFHEVYIRVPGARLILAGEIAEDPDSEWVFDYLKKNGLSSVVSVLGKINRPEIHQLAHAVDCGVISSDYETFSLPALEAHAAGKPVVTTKCGGPEFFINHESLGESVEKGSVTDLATAMLKVYSRRSQYDREVISGHAARHFSSDSVSRLWDEVIRQTIRGE